jgi:hypothetical protein
LLVYRKRDNGREAAAIMIRQVIKLLVDYAIHEEQATINPATMVATRYIGRARKRSRTMSRKEIRLYLHTICWQDSHRPKCWSTSPLLTGGMKVAVAAIPALPRWHRIVS